MQPRILVVDPLADLVHALTALLSAKGWSVEAAGSLVEALAKVDRFEPHVVLVGVETPLEVGIAFATRVRALHDGSVLLVGMSAWSPGVVRDRGPDLFDRICHKPLTDEGIEQIEEVGRRRFDGVSFSACRD